MRIPSLVLVAVQLGCSSSSSTPSDPHDAVVEVALEIGAEVDTSDAAEAASTDASDGAACVLVAAYSSKNTVCNDCAQSRCCVEVNGCLAQTSCNDDYVDCTIGCALVDVEAGVDAGVADCVAKCGVDFPKGKGEYDVAIGCVDAKCKMECN